MSLLKDEFPKQICEEILAFLKLQKHDDDKRFENEYRKIRTIAENESYGDVYEVAHKDTEMVYAIKVIKTPRHKGNLLKTFQEAVISTTLSHRNIVRGYRDLSWVVLPPNVDPEVVLDIEEKGSDVPVETFLKLTGAKFYLTFELFPEDLKSIFPLEERPNGPLESNAPTLDDVRNILIDIASAIDHVHQHDVIHNDVAPRNVVRRTEEGIESRTALCDFGIAQPVATAPNSRPSSEQLYYAPDQCFTKKIDNWSFGMMAFHFIFNSSNDNNTYLTNHDLVKLSMSAMSNNILKLREFVVEFLPNVCKHLVELVVQCLHLTPDRRPTARVIIHILKEDETFSKACANASDFHKSCNPKDLHIDFAEKIYPQWFEHHFLEKIKNSVDQPTKDKLISYLQFEDFPMLRVYTDFNQTAIQRFAEIMAA